eukprot:11623-Heterococcus_DN1.PRE.3
MYTACTVCAVDSTSASRELQIHPASMTANVMIHLLLCKQLRLYSCVRPSACANRQRTSSAIVAAQLLANVKR